MAEQPTSADSFSGVLSGILSNPEMLSMIGSMAQKLKSDMPPSADGEPSDTPKYAPTEHKEAAAQVLPDVVQALAPLLSQEKSKHSQKDEDRACLLRALKPYLNRDRCMVIDYIIKFSSISDVLKNLS